MFTRLKSRFEAWPDAMLTIALLAAAAVIVVIALRPRHELFKALVLAYIVFP